jgi:tRNA dimethylallyltransferase
MYSVKPIKPEIKTEVNKIYKERGLTHLYKMLQFLDPEYAKQISSQDKYRTVRGICLVLSEEKPVSLIRTSFQGQRLPWPYLKIGLHLPREILLKNVQLRTEKMIGDGLLEEVQGLLKRGLADWPIMKSVGYKEAVLYLRHKITKEEMKEHTINRTMQLAKKQMSWFKRDKSIKWYVSEHENWPVICRRVRERVSG